MNSLEIREAKMHLIEVVNEILLPLEVKRMMLEEVMAELRAATSREIDSLLIERESKKKPEALENEAENDAVGRE